MTFHFRAAPSVLLSLVLSSAVAVTPVSAASNAATGSAPKTSPKRIAPQKNVQQGFAVYAKAGTLGIGGGLAVALSDAVRLRGGYDALDYAVDFTSDYIRYDGDLRLRGGEALLDWHPTRGTFRITGGMRFGSKTLHAIGVPDTAQTVSYNGQTVRVDQVGHIIGDADFGSANPYLGIGWGDVVGQSGRIRLFSDIGLAYHGEPTVKLSTACSPTLDPALCATIRQAVSPYVAQEEAALREEAKDYKLWPVFSLGLAFRF